MLVQSFKDYLQETLGIQAQPSPWTNAKTLPFLLRDKYEYFVTPFLSTKCLLMVPKGNNEETPAAIRKHWEMTKKNWSGQAIYVPQKISSFNRKRLIDQKVDFIVPGNQLYLPDLAMDIREHFRQDHFEKEKFSPATQVIVLAELIDPFKEPRNGNQLANAFLPYSLMTITRALNEIEKSGIGIVQTKGRERKLIFELSKKDLWDKALPFLQSPIKKQVYAYDANLKLGPDKIESGLTALAHYSDLVEPSHKTYAFSLLQFKSIERNNDLLALTHPDSEAACLEIWSYDPKRLSRDGKADPFSLYLSLFKEKEEDERVHQALEKMIKNSLW